MKRLITSFLFAVAAVCASAQPPYLQSQTYDVGLDFGDYSHTYFFADAVADVDPADASGHINWKRQRLIDTINDGVFSP